MADMSNHFAWGIDSNTWCPRVAAAMVLSGSAIQTKGLGCWLWLATKRMLAVGRLERTRLMLLTTRDILPILSCPRCGASLETVGCNTGALRCIDPECAHHASAYPAIAGQPVLIDFDDSIVERDQFLREGGASVRDREVVGGSAKRWLIKLLFGRNRTAERMLQVFIEELAQLNHRPMVLIVGGGTIGSGAETLYTGHTFDVIGTDIYLSTITTLAADGHRLPFKDQSIDGVWIQAVLEHVLEPQTVVAEIYRVLRPNGLVYADTPFMQQVHEAAYDFTRFTVSGHRWLFRRFDKIAAGPSLGPGTSLLWSVRHAVRVATRSERTALFAQILFFWLRFLDLAPRSRLYADAASSVYFLGHKSDRTLGPKDMIAFYEEQAR